MKVENAGKIEIKEIGASPSYKKTIRQLIENFYDIQKLRVETYNRIVSYVKENAQNIKKALEDASHSFCETHTAGASHKKLETHVGDASQGGIETHRENANFNEKIRPELLQAIRLLEDAEKARGVKGMKKYSEFVKKFILTRDSILLLTDDLKKHYNEIETFIWFFNTIYKTEKELKNFLDSWSKNHPLRTEFLNHVKGIGPVLATGIIAWLSEPILKAEKPSSIWKYSGLYPNSERKRGEKLQYNLKLKAFCWKLGQSFIKFKCFGRELYLKFKKETKEKHPDWSKLHIHNYARRKMIKIFLACLWDKWRSMNGLPTTEPYPISILGHQDIITWEKWMEK